MQMNVPKFAQEVLAEFDGRAETFSEAQVYDALSSSRKDHGELGEEDIEGFRAEAVAFFFHGRRDEESVWGTYFAPTMTWTKADGAVAYAPDVKELGPNAVAYWQSRAEASKNPILRARYADLVWDLGSLITGQRSDVQYARMASDAYLEATNRGLYPVEVEGIQWCGRALDIALGISDGERVGRIVEFMFELYDRVAKPQFPGTWLFLFDNLYGRKGLITGDQEGQILARLEEMLAQTTATGETFEPWGAKEASERLAEHYERCRESDNVRRVIRAYGQAFETLSQDASPLLALAWLQPVIERYRQAGMKEDAERVQLASVEKGKHIDADLKGVSVTVQIPHEEMEAFLNSMTDGDLPSSLLRVAIYFIPSTEDARAFLKKASEDFPFQARINVVKIDEGQIAALTGSVDEDAEGRLAGQLTQNIRISQLFLGQALLRLRERYKPSVQQLLDFLYASPVFESCTCEMVESGLDAYEREDFVKAIHVLIPQIERALRNLLILLGIPPNKQVRGAPGTMQMKNVNDILADERVKLSLGEDVWRYLQAFLADKRGINLRNLLAHGLLDIRECNRTIADQVFHSLLVLSLIREEKREPPASEEG
jgi:Domain of unknown function (DUF4209)